eukprot:gene15510-32169_t
MSLKDMLREQEEDFRMREESTLVYNKMLDDVEQYNRRVMQNITDQFDMCKHSDSCESRALRMGGNWKSSAAVSGLVREHEATQSPKRKRDSLAKFQTN